MGAVLAVSVGAAWLLCRSSGREVREAVDVLEAVRSRGLGARWPETSRADWFLVRADGRPVAWRAMARRRAQGADLPFVGADVLVRPGLYQATETWALNADATAGSYSAAERVAGERLRVDIVLADGQVTVTQQQGMIILRASSPAPRNYLPEGLMQTVAAAVAERRTAARFKLVFNERLNREGFVHFGWALVADAGQGPAGARKVRLATSRAGADSGVIYEIAPDGRVAAIDTGDARWVRVGVEEVAAVFPDAPRRVQALLGPAR